MPRKINSSEFKNLWPGERQRKLEEAAVGDVFIEYETPTSQYYVIVVVYLNDEDEKVLKMIGHNARGYEEITDEDYELSEERGGKKLRRKSKRSKKSKSFRKSRKSRKRYP